MLVLKYNEDENNNFQLNFQGIYFAALNIYQNYIKETQFVNYAAKFLFGLHTSITRGLQMISANQN